MSGEFVAAMEDVLELYAGADDPKRPRVNFDECSVELHVDAREPEPAAGRRHVTVTERRTKKDFAEQMRRLCDEWYPDADRVRVVLDNLNTHTAGALYEAFAPAEARRPAAKLEFHYTPKHASWLNMAELELSVLARQCLSRRIPDVATLAAEMKAWQDARNRDRVKIEWCFKVADARKKMARVYPLQTPAADH